MDEAIIGAITAPQLSGSLDAGGLDISTPQQPVLMPAVSTPSCAKCGAPACWATSGDPSSFRCSACDLAEEPMRGQPEITPPETHVAYIAKLEATLADMKAEAAICDKDYLAMVDRADEWRKRAEAGLLRIAELEARIAAQDETIRRLADERAALQSLVDEVRYVDDYHDVSHAEMGDERRFSAVAMKEGGWEKATWADWSDDDEDIQ